MKKKILLIDMDGVLVDLETEIKKYKSTHPYSQKYQDNPDLIPDLFKNPRPMAGAIKAIQKLYVSGKYDMVVATTAPWKNSKSTTHKTEWIKKHFGKIFEKNIIITHRKDLLVGDYLIDDRLANGSDKFRGELLHFGKDYNTNEIHEYPNWNYILKKLL